MPARRAVPLTAEGKARLEAELHDLIQTRRPEIVARVSTTRAEGDLRENFGYHDARQALGMLDGRVEAIEAMLRDAEVFTTDEGDGTVQLGSRVTVRHEAGDAVYTLVGPAEVDVARGRISNESPLGAALQGNRAGARVPFDTPAGTREIEIMAVEGG
ncbi:MAG: GreA/GreB family elongation factor [Candidatus Dormibacteria bacterium]